MAELDPTTFRPETRALHSGQKPDPSTQRPGRPDLRDDELRLRRRGARRPAVRAPGVREHLHPDHEPDDGRLRAARRGARGRRRGPGRRVRPGRRDADDPQPRAGGRQHRQLVVALRRDVQPLHPHAAEDRHHDDLCRWHRPVGLRPGDQREDQGGLPRAHRQPAPRRPRPRVDRRRRPRPGRARSSSTTPSPRSSPSRSSTAPTSSSTRRRSGSAATAPRSAASSSTAARSTGPRPSGSSRTSSIPTRPTTASATRPRSATSRSS